MIQNRVQSSANQFTDWIKKEALNHTALEWCPLTLKLEDLIGNLMNIIIFGIAYDEEDPKWLEIQKYRRDGVKKMSAQAHVNFLPFLRWLPSINKDFQDLAKGLKITHEEYSTATSHALGDVSQKNMTWLYNIRDKVGGPET